jgi:hypothetical protein
MDSAALPRPINNRRSEAKRSFLLYDEDDAKSRTRLVSDDKGAGHLLFLLPPQAAARGAHLQRLKARQREEKGILFINLPQRQRETSASTPTAPDEEKQRQDSTTDDTIDRAAR